ncbi:RdgB/HAM1 family non-canonical purine NTP pyrophosphatase [Herbiconiux sp. VKM Ac-1786]|uniref:RdgB/HAM1 family non-canonical purine NTP pyrophosphatase n=1 Tax=Herbiconiux sp. VKM Ac-1786 TaxID=2783824 RepID=UPI001E52C866|nr:RdgB/HAM1 family non-canonical purine NTP pyrophosphatase [Herbiconiux sp. VKM Ac-1786]
MMRVVLATHNAHKVEEFQNILGQALPELEIVAYDGPEPVEDGVSFAENALIKARTAAEHTGLPALADDSGICVDVLGGAPGIFSARWAGHGKGDRANVELLLDQLSDVRDEHRAASFACHIAIVVPATGFEQVVSGRWPGRLAREAAGAGGFGYDPVFVPEGLEVSAAELTAAEKNTISHRARAFEAAIPVLRMNVIPD